MGSEWNHKIFSVTDAAFEPLALELFRFQYENNSVYRNYVNALQVSVSTVRSLHEIPFLPIRFFKSHTIVSGDFEPAAIFESSGTTGSINSRHFVKDLNLYRESFSRAFELFYGQVNEYCILGLLPSYLERQNSSLVYMVDELVQASGHADSGFYLHNYVKLAATLERLEAVGQKTLLIGVTFALLDMAEKHKATTLRHSIVMETGGMKGRREEMIRPQVHAILQRSLGVPAIHSEYGMTELLSQAYSAGNGLFQCPPWMKILVRDDEDPFAIHDGGFANPSINGAVNVIDLANVYSCSFIATDDAGRLYSNGKFEILGRMDNSDLRGCSLMAI